MYRKHLQTSSEGAFLCKDIPIFYFNWKKNIWCLTAPTRYTLRRWNAYNVVINEAISMWTAVTTNMPNLEPLQNKATSAMVVFYNYWRGSSLLASAEEHLFSKLDFYSSIKFPYLFLLKWNRHSLYLIVELQFFLIFLILFY